MKQLNRTEIEQDQVHSAIEQIRKEYSVIESEEVPEQLLTNKYYKDYEMLDKLELLTDQHVKYCTKKLLNIGYSIFHLDVGQPWCLYWPLNALAVLKQDIQKYEDQVIAYLICCQNQGFSGGPTQVPHLAPTYSSLLSLFLMGTPKALESIDRKGLEIFFKSVQDPKEKGSYLMHVNGEADMRAVYIVVIMSLLDGCAEYIASCQTYEGGIGGVRYSEAHGGYTFCGYAALVCMGKAHLIDQGKLLYWLVNRQMEGEGGFNGRTNKVVDACYSFWQGAIFKLLLGYSNQILMNSNELQQYVLMCQNPTGGVFDKPSKNADAYHTCYGLSGYSLATEDYQNPIYNIPNHCVNFVKDYFK